jgi:guanine nucleotide-binding protein G(I)/G(S)/G(T) subunit beta-1
MSGTLTTEQAIARCKEQVAQLQQEIAELRGTETEVPVLRANSPFRQHWNDMQSDLPFEQKGQGIMEIKPRRTLKGHFGKIYSMHWSTDGNKLVSASQDGKLIIWNAFSNLKTCAIPLRSSWVMTCAYSESGHFVACGGLDNVCSVYNVNDEDATAGDTNRKSYAELQQHEGYLSCCRFLKNDNQIITSSGDTHCILWDVETKKPIRQFDGHSSDAMSVSLPGDDDNTFISGSCDTTAKLWDVRAGQNAQLTFHGHESDINSVQFFPDGKCFATASDDASCRLYDIRSFRQLNAYWNDKVSPGVTSVAFSKSGRYLICGYDETFASVWNTVQPYAEEELKKLSQHENRVSCLGVTQDGSALCTGSWDAILHVFA